MTSEQHAPVPELRLAAFQRDVHETARGRGWWDEERSPLEAIALIHAELSEAVEEYRASHGSISATRIENGKEEGFGVEMADAIIRILDLAEHLGIDLESILLRKAAYNKTRPYRHGGKRA
ncbi:MAG TPA: hypothetical protein VNL92_04830 [Dehalococcoidia bacterium]|nr:hypothetical protein [Dehalococcoidia bacterium]